MRYKINIRNLSAISIICTAWFITFFSLSANALKINLGVLYLSPMVLIPIFGFFIFPSIRRWFLNGHVGDRNFTYIYFAVCLFMFLMFVQTMLSDWPMRATSELVKTFLFFFVTHLFFSIIRETKNLEASLKLSLIISSLFFLYLAYLYLLKFGVFFIGNDLNQPDPTGRNTLSLYIFVCTVLVIGSTKDSIGFYQKFFKFFLAFFIIFIGFLTGSRFGIVFPLIFLFTVFLHKVLFTYNKNLRYFMLGTFLILLVILFIVISQNPFAMKDDSLIGILNSEWTGTLKGSGDAKRIILIAVGLECFANNNIFFGHGVKDYLTCVQRSSIGSDLILHNEFLSILNNVGLIGLFLWVFIITAYAKIFSFSRYNYVYRSGVIVYLIGLVIVDGYNSPMFSILLALSRYECFNGKSIYSN